MTHNIPLRTIFSIFPVISLLVCFSAFAETSDPSTNSIIASGSAYTCRTQKDESVVCWGDNWYGQFGTGNTVNSEIPVKVSGLSGVVALAAGDWHTCVSLSNDETKCVGKITPTGPED